MWQFMHTPLPILTKFFDGSLGIDHYYYMLSASCTSFDAAGSWNDAFIQFLKDRHLNLKNEVAHQGCNTFKDIFHFVGSHCRVAAERNKTLIG